MFSVVWIGGFNGSHVKWPWAARRKTAGFDDEMVRFGGAVSTISNRLKLCALKPICTFGDHWSQLNTGLSN